MSSGAPALLLLPVAHLGHWAAVLYAAPVLILIGWAGLARVSGWFKARRRDGRDSGG